MSWIDSHSHILDEAFNDLDEVIERIKKEDIVRCMIVCCYGHEYDRAIALSKKDSRFKVAVGIHPSDVKNLDEFDIIIFPTLGEPVKKILSYSIVVVLSGGTVLSITAIYSSSNVFFIESYITS